MKINAPLAVILLMHSVTANAELSATFTLANDYLFNGVSQTNEKAAFQGSFDWYNNQGLYAGVWFSNLDYGEDTNIEADVYLGFATNLNQDIAYDIGIAQYSYHGADHSRDYNYTEAYAKVSFKTTQLAAWYAWDYFGTGASHSIIMLTHTLELSDNLSLQFGIDQSTSHDSDKFQWQDDDDSYRHLHITGSYQLNGFDLSLGWHDTNLTDNLGKRMLFTIAKTFELN